MGVVPQHGHQWMEMLAGLFRQKGLAKGHGSSWRESTAAAEAEFAEGAATADAATPSAPTAAAVSAKSSAEGATSEPLKAGISSAETTPSEGAPPTICETVESTKATIAERPAEDDTMRRQIDALLEMGLVVVDGEVDREVAQELLRAHGGIEQVVAMFSA